ncbi:M15 family metallopeptidase [Paenarthrobacter aurescens]|uniref:M15 family metallopeptidase n=1 Tax=Paenarthrobacter aurescens TaxID=43663 RepID=UPI0027952A08|nr:M15 family metallopeptidase [Paenarthrobacter aurescens]
MVALTACTPENAVPSPVAANAASGVATPPAAASSVPTTDPVTVTPGTAAPAPSAMPSSAAPSSAVAPQHSLTDPTSPWVVVNKHRPLNPQDFVPADLVQPNVRLAVSGEASLLNSTTAAAAEKMFAAAATEGVVMTLASGYRSYSTQVATYGGYVTSTGQAAADRASARPGHSEHQTGWSFDIGDGGGACSFQPCFAEQPAAVWAKANAHRFGFVVRYPWMFHDTTGYFYESWHLRYIGVEAATDMANRGIATLEEYFGLEAAPDYL